MVYDLGPESNHTARTTRPAATTLALAGHGLAGGGRPTTKALTQLATATPTGWAPTNYDPLTVIGDEQWADFEMKCVLVLQLCPAPILVLQPSPVPILVLSLALQPS